MNLFEEEKEKLWYLTNYFHEIKGFKKNWINRNLKQEVGFKKEGDNYIFWFKDLGSGQEGEKEFYRFFSIFFPHLPIERGKPIKVNLNRDWSDLVTWEVIKVLFKLVAKMRLRKEYNKEFLFIPFDTETFIEASKEDQLKGIQHKSKTNTPKKLAQRCKAIPYYIGYKIDNEIKISSFEDNHSTFLNDLRKYSASRTIVLVAHNAQYDISVISPYLASIGAYVTTMVKADKKFLSGRTTGSIKIQFLDTNFMFNSSLEVAAGMEKRAIDYEKINLVVNKKRNCFEYSHWGEERTFSSSIAIEQEYLKEDVLAVEKLLKNWMLAGELIKRGLGLKKLEIDEYLHLGQAGLGNLFFRKWLFKQRGDAGYFYKIFKPEVDQQLHNLLLDSRVGGLTGFSNSIDIYTAKENESLWKYDINSSYPAIYMDGIPVGPLQEEKEVEDDICWIKFKFKDFFEPKYREVYSDLGCNVLKKSWLAPTPEGTPKEILVTEEYFKLLRRVYTNFVDNITIVSKFYQQRSFDLGECVSFLMNLKQEASREKETVTDSKLRESIDTRINFIKVLMNSQYGKVYQQTYVDKTFYVVDQFKKVENEDITFNSTITGLYIAQTGRLKVVEKLVRLLEKGNKVLYFDTDSVLFVGSNSKDWSPIFEDGLDGLPGGWSFEGRYKEIVLLRDLESEKSKKKYLLVPFPSDYKNQKYIEKSVAFGGVYKFKEALTAMMKRGEWDEYLKIIEVFKTGNPRVERGKKISYLNEYYGQKIIFEIPALIYPKKVKAGIPLTHTIYYDSLKINCVKL